MLSTKKKDLKKKGLGNKPNAAQPVEPEDIISRSCGPLELLDCKIRDHYSI
jgi:hypothetical protein